MGDRYAVKYEGKPFAAKTYHLYMDCSYLQSLLAAPDLNPKVLTPDDSIVDLLEMRVCSGCESRSKEVPAEVIIMDCTNCTPGQAEQVLIALAANDYELKRVKRRKAATTDT